MHQQLLKVANGFNLIYYGLIVTIIAVLLMVISAFAIGFMAAQGQGPALQGLEIWMGILTIAILGGAVLGVIGRFMCLATPEEASNAKSMIVASVVLEVCSLFVTIVLLAHQLGGGFLDRTTAQLAEAGTRIISLIAAILFLLYCKSLAQFLQRRDMVQKASSVITMAVLVVMLLIAGLAIVFLGAAAAGQGGGGGAVLGGACIGSLLMIAAGICAIVWVFMYAGLLSGMSAALRRAGSALARHRSDDAPPAFNDEGSDNRW